jgi:hypothetical protein
LVLEGDHGLVFAEGEGMKRIVLCGILAPLLLFVIQAVSASLILPPLPAVEGSPGLVALSTLITAWTLATLAVTLTSRGWIRMAVLFLVAAGIPANSLLEAIFFPLDIPRALLGPLFLYTFVPAGIFAIVLDRLAADTPAPRAAPGPARAPSAWLLRLATCDVTYIVFYFTAGLAVWPFVSHFYAGRALPGTQELVLMQVVRGLVFSGIVLALVRFLALRPAASSLVVGLTFMLLGGIAPLIVPNPFMPASIRYPHLVEVGVSNFFFASIAATLLRPPRAPDVVDNRSAA